MPQPIQIAVDACREEPVYAQIADQIRAGIAAGELAAGAVLPPVRTLASDLGVNLNTVARAYRRLEDEGFLRIRDRAGAEVARPAAATPATRERLAAELRLVLARMCQAGFVAAEVRRLVEEEAARLPGWKL